MQRAPVAQPDSLPGSSLRLAAILLLQPAARGQCRVSIFSRRGAYRLQLLQACHWRCRAPRQDSSCCSQWTLEMHLPSDSRFSQLQLE